MCGDHCSLGKNNDFVQTLSAEPGWELGPSLLLGQKPWEVEEEGAHGEKELTRQKKKNRGGIRHTTEHRGQERERETLELDHPLCREAAH